VKPKTIRRIDDWLGKPTCLALSSLRRLRRLLIPEKVPAGPPRKILFFKLVEQGATVLAYGAVSRAIAMVGAENVYFCVFSGNRPILEILELVRQENIFEVRQSRFSLFALDSLRVLLKIRRIGIDAFVDMEFFARASTIFGYLTGASRRVGLHSFSSDTPYRGDLLTHRLNYSPYIHTSEAFDALVRALEADPTELPMLKAPSEAVAFEVPAFHPSKEDLSRVQGLLTDCAGGQIEGPIVLLNPNAGDMLPIRKWPEERFVGLGKQLLASHPDMTVVVTGAPAEEAASTAICNAIGPPPRAISLAGKTSLRDLIVLYSLADVLVTNDSGPAHFAALADIHTVVLFGPETPTLFGPLGTNAHVVWPAFVCSPCVSAFSHRYSPCQDNQCLQSIGIEQIACEVERYLGRVSPTPVKPDKGASEAAI
jgi:ADP-heptose:LPS heptosyltransferase